MSYILHILEGLKWALMLPWAALQRLLKSRGGSCSTIGVLLMVFILLVLVAIVSVVGWNMTDFTGLKQTSESIYRLP